MCIGEILSVGEEMCKRLSKMGAKLILSARNEEKLEEVREGLANPEDARYIYYTTDITILLSSTYFKNNSS